MLTCRTGPQDLDRPGLNGVMDVGKLARTSGFSRDGAFRLVVALC